MLDFRSNNWGNTCDLSGSFFRELGCIAEVVAKAVIPTDGDMEERLMLFLEYEKWYNVSM